MHGFESLTILLFACIVCVYIAAKLKIESFIGYIVAGVLIGPNFFNLINEGSNITFFGDLGIVFMIFGIGLELPIKRLKALRAFIFGIGSLQFFLAAPIMCYFSFILLKVSFVQAAILGCGFGLSSTAMIMNVLSNKSEVSSKFGRITFSSLLFQDLVVVPLIIFCNFMNNELSFLEIFKGVSFRIIIALVLLIVILKFLIKPIFKIAVTKKQDEMFILITIFMISLLSLITEKGKLSLELGAFLAGLILSETKYRHQIETEIHSFKILFLGLFFVSVGMSIDLLVLFKNIEIVILITLLVFCIKFFIGYMVNFLFGISNRAALRSALILTGSGEFLFVILKMKNLEFSDVNTNIIFSCVFISMIITPFVDSLFVLFSKKNKKADTTKKPVLIIGFDRVGELVVKSFEIYQIPYKVIDDKINKIEKWQAQNIPIIYLDTSKKGSVAAVDFSEAKLVIINLIKENESKRITMEIIDKYPNCYIFARCLSEKHKLFLDKFGIPHLPVESVSIASSIISHSFEVLKEDKVKSLNIIKYLDKVSINDCKNFVEQGFNKK